jgi:O-antigen/teichoic acid export membrane protein
MGYIGMHINAIREICVSVNKFMDYNEQAGKNFAWLSMAQLGIRIFGVAFFVFLSYKLREVGVGEYSFVTAFVPFWFLVIDFGGGSYLFREWTHGQKTESEIESDFNQLFTLRLILVSIVAIPFLVVNYYINRQVYFSLILFYISMFLATFTSLLDLYFQSKNLYKFLATRQVIEKIAAVFCGVVLLFLRASVTMVFVALLISQIVSIAYYYLVASPFRPRLKFNALYARELFFKGLPFLFIGVFASLYSKIDVTMLRYMTDFSAVGYYGAAYKFIDFTTVVASLFVASVYPLLSPLWQNKEKSEDFKIFFQKCFRIIFSSGLLVTLFLIIGAPILVRGFFPVTFIPAVLGLRILAISQILAFLSMLFSTMLIIEGREKFGLFVVIFGAVFNIVLNIFLIPRFGLYGAAWATVIAEALNLYLLQRYTTWDKPVGLLAKVSIVTVINVAIFFLLKFSNLTNNLYVGGLVLLTNVAILFTVSLLQKQDIALFINPFIAKIKSLNS